MKKYMYTFHLLLCISCNPLLNQYQKLNDDSVKNKLYHQQSRTVRYILNKRPETSILIISWKKNILVQNAPLYYKALLYNPVNRKIQFVKTTEQNPKNVIFSNRTSDIGFKEHLYILDHYLKGKQDHLLTLQNSFSSSEMNDPFHLHDFINDKKLTVNAFAFDEKGEIIQ